jgi:hypothetical protein
MSDGSILFPMHHGTIVLVKTDPDGNVVANDDPVTPVPEVSIRAYPNPCHDFISLKSSTDIYINSANLYNLKGQRIDTSLFRNKDNLTINIKSGTATGLYLLKYTYKRDNLTHYQTKKLFIK